ncbi:hypothetical protein LguiA_012588 [Lonicera macranthoides]
MDYTYRKVTPSLLLSTTTSNCSSNSIILRHHHPSSQTTTTESKVSPNHSITTTNLTQQKSRSSINVQDAVSSFNGMLNSKSGPNIYYLTKLLGSIVKMGEYQTVLSLIQNMELSGSIFKRGCVPDRFTFNTLIKGLFAQHEPSEANKVVDKAGNTNAAIELLRSMGKHNFEADTHCYSMIIDSLCKDRMVSDAMSLFAEMTEKGLSPYVVTYSCLIWGLCNCRQWKEATTLLKEMMERDVFPNVYTFMIERGEVPDKVTYKSLIKGLFAQDKASEANNLFTKLVRERKIELDAVMQTERSVDAISLFDEMIEKGIYPNVVTYSSLIQGFCNVGQLEEATRLLREMLEKKVSPDVYVRTYKTMINGLCQEGLFDEAKELLMRMEECGSIPDDVTYNVIVQGFLTGSQCSEALLLMEKMVGRGFSPNASTISMLAGILPTRGQDSTLLDMIHNFVTKDKEIMYGRGFSQVQRINLINCYPVDLHMMYGLQDGLQTLGVLYVSPIKESGIPTSRHTKEESKILHLRRREGGCSSQRMSVVGMTLKTLRIPKKGKMLLSVHGSPLGLYNKQEDNNINMVDCRERSDQWMNSVRLKDMVVSNIGNHKLTVQEAVTDRSLWSQSCEGTMPCNIIAEIDSTLSKVDKTR